MQFGLYLPPFGDLARARELVEIARAAEDAGWDGFFLWDHVVRPPLDSGQLPAMADPWTVLSGVAAVTSRLRIGPMVTPLARRRPQIVARQSVTLDHLSDGRLTLGIGLGVNEGGELERFGEVTDEHVRSERLDEALELLLSLWSGDTVDHEGPHFIARGVTFLPVPVQRPRIPLWGAALGRRPRLGPLRRAAALDGIFPVLATPDQIRWILDVIRNERGSLEGFDVALELPPDAPAARLDGLIELGANWAMVGLTETTSLSEAIALARSDPARRFGAG
ncbi:MAG: LLM class flavin-dependent oxidoreductase [Actinomycetota bacterium]|nr:LLM class flavin-dependent oxidoreductase [Actinomycetota bacterium]